MERAATTGGGRTYRGQMPVNWYASLALICIVGLLLIGFSRYQRTHQTASSTGPPTTSQNGTRRWASTSAAPSAQSPGQHRHLQRSGLDRQRQRRGDHRPEEQLGVRGQRHPGQVRLRLQGPRTDRPPPCSTRASTAYANGDVCPKGTPDAGKPGVVIVVSWPNFTSNGKGTETSGAPQDLLFANGQLITMAFVPATATVPKPPAQAITALITAVSQAPRPRPRTRTATDGAGDATTATTAPTPFTTTTAKAK